MVQRAVAGKKVYEKVPDTTVFEGLSAASGARLFRVPFSRWYDGLTLMGLKEVQDFTDVLSLVVSLQRSSITFGALADVLGRDVTLGELAEFEAASFAAGTVEKPVPKTRKKEEVSAAES